MERRHRTRSDTIQRVSVVDNVTERLRGALLAGRDQAGRADQGRRAGEELRRQPHPDPRGGAQARGRGPDRRAAAARRRRRRRRPRRPRRPLRPAADRRVRRDPALGRRDDRRAGRGRTRGAPRPRGGRAGPRLAGVLGAPPRVPLGAARAGRELPGSSASSSRSGSPRSATSGCSSRRRSKDAMADHRELVRLLRAARRRPRGDAPSPAPRPHGARRPARVRLRRRPPRPRPDRHRACRDPRPRYGAVPEPGERPEPEAADGKAVVELLAAALNPADLAIASGSFPAGSPPLPYVPGHRGRRPRRRSRAASRPGRASGPPAAGSASRADGAFAERFAAAEEALVEVPDGRRRRRRGRARQAGLAAWMPLALARARPRPARACSCSAPPAASAPSRFRRRSSSAPAASSPPAATRPGSSSRERARRRRDRVARRRRSARTARGRLRRARRRRSSSTRSGGRRSRPPRPSAGPARGSSTSGSRRRRRDPPVGARAREAAPDPRLLELRRPAATRSRGATRTLVGHASAGRIRLDGRDARRSSGSARLGTAARPARAARSSLGAPGRYNL